MLHFLEVEHNMNVDKFKKIIDLLIRNGAHIPKQRSIYLVS